MTLPRNRRQWVWLSALIVAANGFFPAIWILFTSLKTEGELMRNPITYIPAAPTLANYVRAFTDQPLWLFTLNSLIVALASSISLPSIAWSCESSVWRSPWPCSMSMRSQSNPARLMISALMPLHRCNYAPAVGRPSRSARFT